MLREIFAPSSPLTSIYALVGGWLVGKSWPKFMTDIEWTLAMILGIVLIVFALRATVENIKLLNDLRPSNQYSILFQITKGETWEKSEDVVYFYTSSMAKREIPHEFEKYSKQWLAYIKPDATDEEGERILRESVQKSPQGKEFVYIARTPEGERLQLVVSGTRPLPLD